MHSSKAEKYGYYNTTVDKPVNCFCRRIQGNSFEGPIPSSLSNLTSLKSLRISDIYNVSTSLDFIKNLTSLTELVLRNALITGNIPSDIGEYKILERLDLSFNNLTGEIPSGLFSISSLKFLFLGNNSLSGTLPSLKTELEVQNVVMPGLNCLQRNFPCNRDSPPYANFSIKCGGPETPAEGIVYEAENSALYGAAWYDVSDREKWAVSNVGSFENNSYVQNTLAQISATNTPQLYQTSRISPGSLRYYGLGLVNGLYNVSLFFAETGFDNSSQTWKNRGRRVFDIYIQGRRELKDFDISKEAGGVERALQKNFTANVSENYLEIHLFWAGKGTCCIPVQGYYGPLISAIHVVSDFVSNVTVIPPSNRGKKSRLGLIIGIAVPVGVVSLIFIFAVFYMKRKPQHNNEDGKNITAVEGTLSDGRIVAVKQLSVASHHGRSQFAWTLHENNQSLRLVDPTLSEFDENEAARVMAVSLMCTQASPNMRPPMSRVVAMLAGDIDVGIVTSKPSYLTDWSFKDVTSSFLSEEDRKHHEDNTDLSQISDPFPSSVNVTQTMFGGIIGDGR
ncbi:putative lrr receptor-like serine/threonine-protein kinase [Quercus suber]|uniref:non-specific serine/threonine protein kinase n=1 Tax=Quercus suber TaxID=58331 RepID=A0AAW0LMG6_QUESU